MSVNCRRQALQLCLDSAVVVVIQIFNEVQFEVFHGAELLQIQQFTFEQPEGIFYHHCSGSYPFRRMLCWMDFVHSLAQCPVVYGDIVATSNGDYPLDQNLYQTPKTVATAESCVREDGVIIMVASCVDGMGGTFFEKLIVQGSVEEIDKYLSHIPPKETISEQWCVQIYTRI